MRVRDGEEKVKELQHLPAFKDAAGSQSLGYEPRKEGLKANFVPGVSQVDEVVFGSSASSDRHDHLHPEGFQGPSRAFEAFRSLSQACEVLPGESTSERKMCLVACGTTTWPMPPGLAIAKI